MSKAKDKNEIAEVNIDRDNYNKTVTPSGVRSLNNGDEVASLLNDLSSDELFKVSKEFLGEDFKARYKSLNQGMQRMNLGNRIRAAVHRIDNEDNKKVGIDALKKVANPFVKARKKANKEKEVTDAKNRKAEAKKKADAKIAAAKEKRAAKAKKKAA